MEAGPCPVLEASQAIHTIGHSTRTLARFLELLSSHRVDLVLDVRRRPSSQRYPHFGREKLGASLEAAGVDYVWRGDLGGYRRPSPDSPNTAWRAGAFRAYADFLLTPEFEGIMEGLLAIAAQYRAALMCAEAVPWRCHRQLLADAFLVRGWQVQHILDDRCHPHRLPSFARTEGVRILYSERAPG